MMTQVSTFVLELLHQPTLVMVCALRTHSVCIATLTDLKLTVNISLYILDKYTNMYLQV